VKHAWTDNKAVSVGSVAAKFRPVTVCEADPVYGAFMTTENETTGASKVQMDEEVPGIACTVTAARMPGGC
jgi:hypothetical protein